jgi:hypothetical protein
MPRILRRLYCFECKYCRESSYRFANLRDVRGSFFSSVGSSHTRKSPLHLLLSLRCSVFSPAGKFFQADCEFLQALGDGFVDVVFFRVAIDG